MGVTCLTLKSTPEQRGPIGAMPPALGDPQKSTSMAASRNPVTQGMGRLPVFVWSDSGVISEDTPQKDIQQNYASACHSVTYGICPPLNSPNVQFVFFLCVNA